VGCTLSISNQSRCEKVRSIYVPHAPPKYETPVWASRIFLFRRRRKDLPPFAPSLSLRAATQITKQSRVGELALYEIVTELRGALREAHISKASAFECYTHRRLYVLSIAKKTKVKSHTTTLVFAMLAYSSRFMLVLFPFLIKL
jgi:hypothetical protein